MVLCGGSSRLDGICEAAHSVFGIAARSAQIQSNVKSELRQPEYSTALGLLHYALTGQEGHSESSKPSSFISSIIDIFKVNYLIIKIKKTYY